MHFSKLRKDFKTYFLISWYSSKGGINTKDGITDHPLQIINSDINLNNNKQGILFLYVTRIFF